MNAFANREEAVHAIQYWSAADPHMATVRLDALAEVELAAALAHDVAAVALGIGQERCPDDAVAPAQSGSSLALP